MFGRLLHRPRLFISYRRADAESSAGHLCTLLRQQFGRDRVFLDTRSLAFGEDFCRAIHDRIAEADRVVAIIGPGWLDAANERGRRLDQDDDPVRFEIATALRLGKPIVPVLLNGAAMPRAEQLPPDLRELHKRVAAPMRDATFETDFEPLVDELLGRRRGRLLSEVDRMRRVAFAAAGWALWVPLCAPLLMWTAWTGALDLLQLDTLAQRWLLGAAAPAGGDANLLLVTIDAASEQALGREFTPAQAPAWRRDHARLVERAVHAGARAVVFDLVLGRSDAQTADADAALARAVRAAAPTRVVFGVQALAADGRPQLADALRDGAVVGFVCLLSRGAGTVWSVPLAEVATPASNDEAVVAAQWPALALAAHTAAMLRSADLDRRELGFDGTLERVRYSAQRRQRDDGGCPAVRAGAAYASLILRPAPEGHWRTPERSVSYADALDAARVPDARLAGRTLLVGQTALKRAPLHDDSHVVRDGLLAARKVWGVELHADAVAALAAGAVPRLPGADRQAWTALAASVLGALAAVALFTRLAWVRRAAVGALAAAWLALAWWLARRSVLLNVGYDLLALALTYAVTRAVQRLAAWRQARGGIDP